MAKKRQCSRMAGDIRRIAGITADLGSGNVGVPGSVSKGTSQIKGMGLGPEDNHVYYELSCVTKQKANAFGPGTCSVYEIKRQGPGAKGLKKRATVGNIYGLAEQLSRDTARLWGCAPEKTPGFEGRRRRRRRR